jgi:hypothetical protein
VAKDKQDPNNSGGVRGPRGPQFTSGSNQPAAPRVPKAPKYSSSPRRAAFERKSFPVLARVTAAPRWLLVVGLGSSLLLGLVLSDSWAWLGAIFLLIVAAFLGWLLALSWPLLSSGRRFMRILVVGALVGMSILKLGGSF